MGRYETKESAQEFIDRQTAVALKMFCPLTVSKCHHDCICFMRGEIQNDGVNFRVPFVGCANGMFD